MAIFLSGCASGQRESSSKASTLSSNETTQVVDNSSVSDMSSDTEKESFTISNESNPLISQQNDNSTMKENIVEKMTLQIGNNTFMATLENNDAVDALVDMMREASIVIQMNDYSGFEKVGLLGTSLPTSNKQTTTQSGDIVLYNGNQIVSCYFSRDAFANMTKDSKYSDNKELLIISEAVHTDLYDKTDIIPFEELERFFEKYLV